MTIVFIGVAEAPAQMVNALVSLEQSEFLEAIQQQLDGKLDGWLEAIRLEDQSLVLGGD